MSIISITKDKRLLTILLLRVDFTTTCTDSKFTLGVSKSHRTGYIATIASSLFPSMMPTLRGYSSIFRGIYSLY